MPNPDLQPLEPTWVAVGHVNLRPHRDPSAIQVGAEDILLPALAVGMTVTMIVATTVATTVTVVTTVVMTVTAATTVTVATTAIVEVTDAIAPAAHVVLVALAANAQADVVAPSLAPGPASCC